MTLEERERFKRAEAAEKQRQQEIRVRHGGLLHVANTDPYEETPAEEPVDTLANKPSVGFLSVLIRVGLFVMIALGFVVYRSGQPGRVVAIAGLNVPLDLKVAGAYQNLLGGGRDSPGAVAVYLHHDARSAADWSGLAPFADDAPNANDAPFFLHLATAKISKTILFVCDGNAPAAALRDATTRGGASAALGAALDDALAAAAPTPRAGARLFVACHEGATRLLYQPEPGSDGKVAYVPMGGATLDEELVCDPLLQALLGPQAEARDQTAALELRESVAAGFGNQAAFSEKKRFPVHGEL